SRTPPAPCAHIGSRRIMIGMRPDAQTSGRTMVSETAPAEARTDATSGEMQVLASVSAAHLVSHFYILVLPVTIPLLQARLRVGFVELGLALTVFNVVSGLTQAPMGFLVDRIGARIVLIAGLCLGGLAFGLLGIVTTYSMLMAVAVLAG